jgi:putative acetyltransferase
LGHPEYYPRFGFERASKYRLVSQWDGVPDDAFMIAIFDKTLLPEIGGVVRYLDEFSKAV